MAKSLATMISLLKGALPTCYGFSGAQLMAAVMELPGLAGGPLPRSFSHTQHYASHWRLLWSYPSGELDAAGSSIIKLTGALDIVEKNRLSA